MIGFLRDLRLVPIVLMASACLLALKLAGLLLDRGYIDNAEDASAPVRYAGEPPAAPKQPEQKLSWAEQMFNFPSGRSASPSEPAPGASAARDSDITGSIGEKPGAEAPKSVPAKPTKPTKPSKPIDGTLIDPEHPTSGAERMLLERLQQRRHELDSRARELDIRENLIKAAEKRLEARLAELKSVEGRINTEMEKKDEAETARLKGLVTMYENMKPRDAAKIFDRLDLPVLFEVSSKINPRRMADILAQMSAEAAERLTVEIANRAKSGGKPAANAELPKIEGRPNIP